tara:strand:- start:139 stop:1089 length:951 start_codon:yes stop_codon:yes gene_type:complete
MRSTNIVSVSGGKDSTATLLLAIERQAENLRAVFCDTGHEHPETLAYVDRLSQQTGVQIEWVKADFSKQIAKKRARIEDPESDWPEHLRREALATLLPTGIPFLDMVLWKGRFPSTKVKFCTQHLKREPFTQQVIDPLIQSQEFDQIVSWVGVRRDESRARADVAEWEMEFGDENTGEGVWLHRPIASWTAEDVFSFHRKHGVEWNPLYEQGMGRVGCMPCINARKNELREIARRYPEEVERVAEWERIASKAAKRGCATFFAARGETDVSLEKHGIHNAVDWSRTSRGGRQFDLIAVSESEDEAPMCQSLYGLCE